MVRFAGLMRGTPPLPAHPIPFRWACRRESAASPRGVVPPDRAPQFLFAIHQWPLSLHSPKVVHSGSPAAALRPPPAVFHRRKKAARAAFLRDAGRRTQFVIVTHSAESAFAQFPQRESAPPIQEPELHWEIPPEARRATTRRHDPAKESSGSLPDA